MTPGRWLACLAPLLLAGCVTRSLWKDWQDDPPPTPVAIARAVRTGDGAFHVLVRCDDDVERRLVVRPFEQGPADDGAWPDANRRGELVVFEADPALPRGFPLRTEVDPDEATGAVLNDQPLIQLVDRTLRVQDRGGAWTLATFPPPPPPQPTRERARIVALTPLALLADMACLVGFPFILVGYADEALGDEPAAPSVR